jgi:dipeptidyl aminopeptidase/acylaminoacyl peptidase
VAGSVFDGDRIERVNVETGEVEVLYRASHGAKCGVATYHPTRDQVVFILGPANPTPDWDYGPSRRQGVVVDIPSGRVENLDARDLSPPFTPGALRGGSHVHVFSPDGRLLSFTYNDQLVASEQRNVGVSVIGHPVAAARGHVRNHDGSAFSVLVTRTVASPRPGSDEIRRAYEDAWVGRDGRTIAFIGEVVGESGEFVQELFVADLPADFTRAGNGPLQGTPDALPAPPAGVRQRRLTRTAGRKFPGLSGPRHWVRSSPDGTRIAFLMKDDQGIAQLWTIAPAGGEPVQLTRNPRPIASAFSWHPDGRQIAFVMDDSVCVADVRTGRTSRLTQRREGLRPEACVFSPDGRRVAYVRTAGAFNQISTVGWDSSHLIVR